MCSNRMKEGNEYQNKGIGKSLIWEGLRIAKELGFKSVIVLGHEQYYPQFSFKPARIWYCRELIKYIADEGSFLHYLRGGRCAAANKM